MTPDSDTVYTVEASDPDDVEGYIDSQRAFWGDVHPWSFFASRESAQHFIDRLGKQLALDLNRPHLTFTVVVADPDKHIPRENRPVAIVTRDDGRRVFVITTTNTGSIN